MNASIIADWVTRDAKSRGHANRVESIEPDSFGDSTSIRDGILAKIRTVNITSIQDSIILGPTLRSSHGISVIMKV